MTSEISFGGYPVLVENWKKNMIFLDMAVQE